MKRTDITGNIYGRLTALRYVRSSPGRKSIWLCRCVCGTTVEALLDSLRRGDTQSCGCLKTDYLRSIHTTHGLSKTSTYHIWCGMIRRCHNPASPRYHHYGGRGIEVCARWRESFTNFVDDMGLRPPGMSLDRYPNNNGHYTPENCRWATQDQQMRNTRVNVLVTFQGITRTISQWAETTGISVQTLRGRLKAGWSPDDALTLPKNGRYVRRTPR